MKIAWTIYAILACLFGAGGLLSYLNAESAPQQAAAACFALASVAVPYLILRGFQEVGRIAEEKEARIQRNIREAMAANPAPAGEGVDPDKLRRMAAQS
jgi:hypothetical protein